MPILRIERKERTYIDLTAIIGVPSKEWERMRRISRIRASLPLLVMFAWLVGFGILISFFDAILPGTVMISILLVYMVIIGLLLFLAMKMAFRGAELQRTLLKKHGWDGEMDYRVEHDKSDAILHRHEPA